MLAWSDEFFMRFLHYMYRHMIIPIDFQKTEVSVAIIIMIDVPVYSVF